MQVSLDFYTFLAYLILGFVAVKGIIYSKYASFDEFSGKLDLKLIGSLLVSAIMVGMMLSVIRASTIDRTFDWDLSWVPGAEDLEQAGPRGRCDPDFSKLADKVYLATFKEAKNDDKRPYQFYGNSLIAILVFAAGSFFWKARFCKEEIFETKVQSPHFFVYIAYFTYRSLSCK